MFRALALCLSVLPASCSGKGSRIFEPDVASFYGSFEPVALENTTYSDVQKYLLEGRPFVVVDGARGLPMASWDCNFVKVEFPDSRIRQEGGRSDVNEVPMSSDWTQLVNKFNGAEHFPEGAPRNRPFYWDIAKASEDEKHREWGKNPRAVVRKIVQSSAVPYWLPPQDAKSMGFSSEMWFHPKGAGAPAHMDPHCHTTVSFCFSGARKWRMMLPPAEPHRGGYFDGEIYGARDRSRRGEWKPTFALDAPAGSAVVVYPGMIHETLSTGEECSSSISQTFGAPLAAGYFRAFWPRFSLIHEDVGHCSGVVEELVSLGSGASVAPAKEPAARKAGQAFAAGADGNGDGVISEQEVQAKNRHRLLEELVAFHDTDKDGVITVSEVVESWVMFSTSMHRVLQRQKRGEL